MRAVDISYPCVNNYGQIYVRTCRVRNAYRKGHADVLCNYFLIDAFMLQGDGLVPGTCAQRGPLRNRR